MDEMAADLLSRAEEAYRLAVADPAAARPVAAAMVAEARVLGDVESLVVSLRAQAWSDRTLLAGEHAKELLDEAAQLARRAGLETRLGEVLVVRAAVNHELGHSRAAQRDLDTARPLLGASALAELEHQSAVLHHNAGRLKEAAAIYRRVLADPDCPAAIRAKESNNLGLIEADFGHYATALDLLQEARRLAEHVGPAYTAYFAEGQARVMAQAGMLPESLDMFETAERLYEKAGLPTAELYTEYADAMSDLMLLPEAANAARRGMDEFDANHIPLMRAEAQLRVARLSLLTGALDAAESASASAAETLRAQGRVGWAASADVVHVQARAEAGRATLEDLHRVRRAAVTLERLKMCSTAVDAHLTAGRVSLLLDRRAWAEASLDRADALARRAAVLVRLKGRSAAATAALLRDDKLRSLRECRAGLTDLERHRGVLASTELRVLASAHGAELGRLGLRTLIDSGSGLEVFQWMERTRAVALLAVQQVPLDGYAEELAQLRSHQDEMESGGGTPEEVARHTELENRLRRLTWAATSTASSHDRPATVSGIRDLLVDRVLVEYGVLDGDVFAVVLSRKRGLVVHHLGPLAEVQVETDKLLFLLRLLSQRTTETNAARLRPVAELRVKRLRDLLTEPLRVRPDQEMVVVPVGILQRLPWPALHDGPLSVSPSAAFWMRTRQQSPPSNGTTLLAAGPGLAAANDEVRRLGALHERSSVLLPPESTVDVVAADLKGASLVHFACHGQVRADNPMFSGLLLSDGALTVQELELRGIAPYRVVLAACEAAADVAYPGGEMLGFVSALLARGTAGLVASTIVVPDEAATALMVGLHERVRSQTLSIALHGARNALDLEDPSEFVNWCGFTAFGAA